MEVGEQERPPTMTVTDVSGLGSLLHESNDTF